MYFKNSLKFLFSNLPTGVDVRVARIFNTYGPRMHMNDGRVVSNFVIQALQNEPITVKKTNLGLLFVLNLIFP